MRGMDSTYSGAYGRLKVARTELLSFSTIRGFLSMGLDEITRVLSSTVYKEDINALYTLYKNPELLEMAANRRLSARNRLSLFAPPPAAADMLKAYMSKWDVENIKAILSSKYLGYSMKQTETFLLSFRDVPVGIFGGNMTREDFNVLLNQQGVEGVAEALTRYGYGSTVLQYIENYRKDGDIAPMLQALDRYYYTRLFSSLRFYLGSEGPLVRYFKEEVDMKNFKILLSGKDASIPFEKLRDSLLPFGTVTLDGLQSLYSADSVSDMVSKLTERFDLGRALERYRETGELGLFEQSMRSSLLSRYLGILDAQSLSSGAIFSYIFRAERERDNIRTVVTGKAYGLPPERIEELLVGAE